MKRVYSKQTRIRYPSLSWDRKEQGSNENSSTRKLCQLQSIHLVNRYSRKYCRKVLLVVVILDIDEAIKGCCKQSLGISLIRMVKKMRKKGLLQDVEPIHCHSHNTYRSPFGSPKATKQKLVHRYGCHGGSHRRSLSGDLPISGWWRAHRCQFRSRTWPGSWRAIIKGH